MIPSEWIDQYLEKSGDERMHATEYAHHNEHGFATWNIGEHIIVCQVYGDGKWWLGFFKDMGEKLGKNIRFFTRRNPKAWQRAYGARVVGWIMEVD